MRVQDGSLRLQDGSWRPTIQFGTGQVVDEGSICKGLAAFTEPMGEYEGDPQSTIIIQVLI